MNWKKYYFRGLEYEVNELGEVKSLKTGLLLKQRLDSDGYLSVTVGRERRTNKRIHRIIAELFIENPNNYKEVNHIDGIKINNNISNLEWCTRSHNVKHAFDNNLKPKPKGERNGRSKLLDSDILEIRDLLQYGFTRYEIAKIYEVSWTAINFIHQNKTWKHI